MVNLNLNLNGRLRMDDYELVLFVVGLAIWVMGPDYVESTELTVAAIAGGLTIFVAGTYRASSRQLDAMDERQRKIRLRTDRVTGMLLLWLVLVGGMTYLETGISFSEYHLYGGVILVAVFDHVAKRLYARKM